jgi:hypothetical protein
LPAPDNNGAGAHKCAQFYEGCSSNTDCCKGLLCGRGPVAADPNQHDYRCECCVRACMGGVAACVAVCRTPLRATQCAVLNR